MCCILFIFKNLVHCCDCCLRGFLDKKLKKRNIYCKTPNRLADDRVFYCVLPISTLNSLEENMSLFPAGQYKFKQKDEICNRKSVIFVKLTDSAHRALNEFLKNKDTCTEIPTIEFNDESGLIELPSLPNGSSQTNPSTAKFKFDVESNMAMQGRQGRFECIKHKNGSENIQKYGLLKQRLKIHAKDDVFETTKIRMAEVELDKRKVCTKKIDLKHETVRRRSKVDKSPNLRTSLTSESKVVKFGTSNNVRNRNKNENAATKLNNPTSRRPLKERLIHMLAVKPMKKIELLAALRKNGLKDSDKALFHSALMSIATVKDNVHHLLRHVWNDVLDDWPFYNEEEREQMKRNKSQNLILSNNSQSTTSNLSPKLSSPINQSPSRPGYKRGIDGLPTKRLRISHFNRPNSVPIIHPARNNEDSDEILATRLTNCFDDNIERISPPNSLSKTSPRTRGSKVRKSEESGTDTEESLSAINSVVSNECDKQDKTTCSEEIKKENPKPVRTYESKKNKKFEIDKPDIHHSNNRKEECNPGKVRKENCDPEKIEKTDSISREKDYNPEKMGDDCSDVGETKKTSSREEDSNSWIMKQEECDSTVKEETDMFAQFPIGENLFRINSSDSDETSSCTEEYVTITNVEQRRQYKNDFMEYYTEYKVAYTFQMQVFEELRPLEKQIRQCEKGSLEFLELKQRILQKQTQLVDKRFNDLRKLLTRIKKLVLEYDEKMS